MSGPPPDRQTLPTSASARVTRASRSSEGKLLAPHPLATGTGAFLLGDRVDSALLAPIGIFGAVVASGLYLYEFRGVQRCHRLEAQARKLEAALGLDSELGQFRGQPDRLARDMIARPRRA
jgi:hypothetical protein